MRDPNNPCIFCFPKKKDFIFENELAYVTKDTYPVSKFHSLIIPKRCVMSYFDLTLKEILACNKLIKVAGQSINHCHIHLIPRRINDVKNPQGGVRAVISSKQHYVRKK